MPITKSANKDLRAHKSRTKLMTPGKSRGKGEVVPQQRVHPFHVGKTGRECHLRAAATSCEVAFAFIGRVEIPPTCKVKKPSRFSPERVMLCSSNTGSGRETEIYCFSSTAFGLVRRLTGLACIFAAREEWSERPAEDLLVAWCCTVKTRLHTTQP